MEAIQKLEAIVVKAFAALSAISDYEAASERAVGKWSKKKELGHLVDSACNNHQRIVRAQVEDQPSLSGYEGDRWVALHDYQNLPWSEILECWRVMNQHLIRSASHLSPEVTARKLTVGGNPVTLEFIVDDYVRHLLHHLHHIGVEVEVDDVALVESTPSRP